MPKSRKKKKAPKRVLALPDLEQAKAAVLNTLTSTSGQRTYDHAITVRGQPSMGDPCTYWSNRVSNPSSRKRSDRASTHF